MFNSRETACVPVDGNYTPPSVSERLKKRKADLEMELAKVNSALDAWNRNPEIAEVIDVLSKLSM